MRLCGCCYRRGQGSESLIHSLAGVDEFVGGLEKVLEGDLAVGRLQKNAEIRLGSMRIRKVQGYSQT